MKTSATSFIKSILLIGYAQDYRVLLSKYFTTILPDATIDEYNIKDGCPGSASNDFPAVIMLTGKSNESVIVQAFR